jgi:hypothetical protein
VICTSLSRASLEYYLRSRHDSRITLFSYPRDTALHLGSQNDEGLLAKREALVVEIDSVWAEVDRHFRDSGRSFGQTFVLVVLNEVNRSLHEDLRSGKRPSALVARQLGVFRCSGSGDRIGMDLVSFDRSAVEPSGSAGETATRTGP